MESTDLTNTDENQAQSRYGFALTCPLSLSGKTSENCPGYNTGPSMCKYCPPAIEQERNELIKEQNNRLDEIRERLEWLNTTLAEGIYVSV